MKKLKIILLLSALAMSLSCYKIRDSLNRTPEPKYAPPIADLPKNIENASPDSHFWEEKAVVVSSLSKNSYYVGNSEYPLDEVGHKISRMLTENPSEQSLIYLNLNAISEFGEATKILDTIRKTDSENVGLMAYRTDRAVGTDIGVLKVKIPAEPKMDDDDSVYSNRQLLQLKKGGKIFFGSTDAKGIEKLDKTETKEEEVAGKISQILSGKDNKTFYIKSLRSSRYIDVVRLINTATGAGASTVYLQIDDLDD
jgi:biopolymer transport protein ExbD